AKKKQLLTLGKRLEPGGTLQLDFSFVPEKRGKETVRISGVISQFPFGFLRKTIPGGAPEELIIWPRRVAYRFNHPGSSLLQFSGNPLNKPGSGSEVIDLREYRHGDSHRQIHWKASARLRSLVVQQFGAEHLSGFTLELDTAETVARDERQFELLCSLASSMADDLWAEDRLHAVRVNGGGFQKIARRSDVDFFQDQLATLERVAESSRSTAPRGRSIVTFEPIAEGGIHAFVGGQKAATA